MLSTLPGTPRHIVGLRCRVARDEYLTEGDSPVIRRRRERAVYLEPRGFEQRRDAVQQIAVLEAAAGEHDPRQPRMLRDRERELRKRVVKARADSRDGDGAADIFDYRRGHWRPIADQHRALSNRDRIRAFALRSG